MCLIDSILPYSAASVGVIPCPARTTDRPTWRVRSLAIGLGQELFRFLGRPPSEALRLPRKAGVQESSKAEPQGAGRDYGDWNGAVVPLKRRRRDAARESRPAAPRGSILQPPVTLKAAPLRVSSDMNRIIGLSSATSTRRVPKFSKSSVPNIWRAANPSSIPQLILCCRSPHMKKPSASNVCMNSAK